MGLSKNEKNKNVVILTKVCATESRNGEEGPHGNNTDYRFSPIKTNPSHTSYLRRHILLYNNFQCQLDNLI